MSNLVKPTIKAEAAHSESIWSVAFASESLLTGSLDGTLKLWKTQSDKLVLQGVTTSQKFGVTSVAATSDGSIAAAAYQNGVIRFFQTEDMIECTLDGESSAINAGILEAWTVSMSHNDEVIASGSHSGSINIWSMQDRHEKLATMETGNKLVMSSAFSSDSKLVSSSIDGFVNIFDLSTQQVIHKVEAHALPIRSVTFSPNGKLVYTASDDRHVTVYDTLSGTLVNSFSHRGMAFSVSTAPDERHFVVGCANHSVCLWDLGMQRRVQAMEQHSGSVWSVCYKNRSREGEVAKQIFASVGDDALLQLYE